MGEATLNNRVVLLVEDEDITRSLVARTLKTLNVSDVLTADNGAEAIALMERRDDPIDVIISDIEMPVMDGFEFSRKVRYGAVPAF